ncbi:MAG: aldehyde dehydrogenase family protein [Polyangiaceae bacterium]
MAAACGERLILRVMELGGKAPLIACADADLERTARAIVTGGFANSGQACISVERVYAAKEIHDALVERVTALTNESRQGDPAEGKVDVGAITFPKQAEVAEKLLQDALSKGAKLMAGGKRRPGPGCFFEPTVLAECSHEMNVMKEEIFGPIVPIMRVESEEQAVALANESHLGLNAYVFSTDRERARRVASRVSAGSVVVNDVLSNYACPEAPFGGVRQSGFGRVHGEDALRDLAVTRHLSTDRVRPPAHDPLWHPYSEKKRTLLLKGMRVLFSRRGVIGKLRGLL